MNKELEAALASIKGYVMSPAEIEAQQQSFVRSMMLIDEESEEAQKRIAEYWMRHDPNDPLKWSGVEGDYVPRRWFAYGTMVYRTAADAYDD